MSLQTKVENSFKWYAENKALVSPTARVFRTRDSFHASLDSLFQDVIKKGGNEAEASLLSAVVGEIGNNGYDHNLGLWKDEVGCYVDSFSENEQYAVIVADRGQGILNSLKNVIPNLCSNEEALSIAFEKKISGRSPEKRGNGLKFVRSVVNENKKRGLFFHSGSGFLFFGGKAEFLKSLLKPHMSSKGQGVYSILLWEFL